MLQKKRATLTVSVLVQFALYAIILFLILTSIFPKMRTYPIQIWDWIGNKTGIKDEFESYDYLADEERIVENSMTALQMAINSVARGESVNVYDDNKTSPKNISFDYYTISFSGRIELEEGGMNDYRDWNFVKRFDINQNAKEIEKRAEEYVFADYKYGSCPDVNKKKWINRESYCNDGDDYDAGGMANININTDRLKKAKEAGLAPVREITPVYNIELTVHYKDGTECKVGTWDQNKKITDTSKDDLLVWGATSVKTCYSNPDFKEGDGCDRDGDGVQGAYGSGFHNLGWREVIDGTTRDKKAAEEKKSLVSEKEIATYFPGGVIQPISDNGEGCLDSPTWLECDGVRIYYCGKLGYKSGAGGEESNHYFHIDGIDDNVHSNAGIKILRDISDSYSEEISSVNRDETIEIRDKDANSRGSRFVGAWEYAKEYDLDVVLGAPLAKGGLSALSMRKLDDPSVYCYNGKKINEGPVTVKCDSSTQTCGVCDFELPQNISRDYEGAFAWFSGYGDPKYVVYYEAFPEGEDEAWTISPLDVSFTTIALVNVGVHAGMPIGGYILKQGGKLVRFFGRAAYHIPVAGKLIKATVWAGKISSNALSFIAKRASRLVKAGVNRATKKISKEFYETMFKQADDVLKGVSDDVLRKIGTNLDEVTKLMEKGAMSANDLVKEGIVDNVDDVIDISSKELIDRMTSKGISKEIAEATDTLIDANLVLTESTIASEAQKMAAELYKKGIMPRGIVAGSAKATRIALYTTAALTLAWEDSRNQKFLSIGVNKIGMKEPYGRVLTKELDSKANNYTIMLRKDEYRGGKLTNIVLDQVDSRFYLASPCKADLALVKANKECWKMDFEAQDKSGKKIKVTADIPEGEALKMYGNVPFLSHTIDKDYDKTDPRRYENAIKECVDKSAGFTGLTWESPKYNTQAIIVNPIPQGNIWDEGNFCYGGSHTLAEMGKVGILLGTIGAGFVTEAIATSAEATAIASCPLTIGATCVAVPLIEITQTGADIGIDVAMAYAMNKVEKGTKWPNH